MHWRRKWQPIPVFLPGESQGRGSLVGCTYGVAQSQIQLKRLHSSSSSPLMPSLSAYRLTWFSLTLDVGYRFTAASAKHSHCSFPWSGVAPPGHRPSPAMWGGSSQLHLCIVAAARARVLSGIDKIGIITMRMDKK